MGIQTNLSMDRNGQPDKLNYIQFLILPFLRTLFYWIFMLILFLYLLIWSQARKFWFCVLYSSAHLLTCLFHQFRDDIILSVLGPGGSRILELRDKSNPELLKLYDVELILRLHNACNLKDTRRLLEKFTIFLAGQTPSAIQTKAFLAGYAGRQPRTIYRYLQTVPSDGTFRCFGLSWNGTEIPLPISRSKSQKACRRTQKTARWNYCAPRYVTKKAISP